MENNKVFTELEAKKILQDTYPQIKRIETRDTKKSFVFDCYVLGNLFFDGKFFHSVGFSPGSKVILLEVKQENLTALHAFRYGK